MVTGYHKEGARMGHQTQGGRPMQEAEGELLTGPSILVSYDALTEGAAARADTIARDLAASMWADRNAGVNQYLSVAETCDYIRHAVPGRPGPLVISDYSDNPGAGAYGDATNLLAGLLDMGLQNAAFGPLIDPEAAAELNRHAPWAIVTLPVGGKQDPRYGGPPPDADGRNPPAVVRWAAGW